MIQINALRCNKAVFGTGLVPCELKLKDFKSFIIVPNSWSVNVTSGTFDKEYVIAQIQAGIFVPFLNALEFTNNTPDVTTKEYQGGIMSVIRNGKPQYTFEYDNGIGWHKAAYSYNSFQGYSVLIVDSTGTIAAASSVDGTILTGFKLSMLNTGTYTPQVGDETAKTLISFQIANEEQFNRRMALITADEAGVDINSEIAGVIGVTITGTASVANGINVVVNAGNNTIFGIEGLTADNFRVRNAATNATLTIATVVAGTIPGTYKITTTPAPTLASNLIVDTYDSDADVTTALVGDSQLYRGLSEPIVVGA